MTTPVLEKSIGDNVTFVNEHSGRETKCLVVRKLEHLVTGNIIYDVCRIKDIIPSLEIGDFK